MAKGMALGADTYMTKPFSTKDLVTRVKQMLGA
jgi:DNA-binding response OmpR family regulator